jgi:hypothetical protein
MLQIPSGGQQTILGDSQTPLGLPEAFPTLTDPFERHLGDLGSQLCHLALRIGHALDKKLRHLCRCLQGGMCCQVGDRLIDLVP